MIKAEIKARLDKMTPELRKLTVQKIVKKINARRALVAKHSHLFTDDEEPATSAPETGNEPKPNE